MLRLHKLRSAEGSAIVSFALGAPLVLFLTLGVIDIAGALWSKEVANNVLNRLTIEAAREGSNLNAISAQWQTAMSESHVQASPIRWVIKRVGVSTRVISATSDVELMTIGLPLAQNSTLAVQVVME